MRPPIGRLSRRDAETDPSNERTELIQVAKLEFAVVTDFDHETRAGAKATTSAGSAQTGDYCDGFGEPPFQQRHFEESKLRLRARYLYRRPPKQLKRPAPWRAICR
jgi:hypothetical protein